MSITEVADPLSLFNEWFDEAKASNRCNPEAAALATATRSGRPSVRMVLVKRVDQRGFAFFTNLRSRKGQDLAVNPQAALCFYWEPLGRQVRVEGRVRPVSDGEADAYFAMRPREARVGAWASRQSRSMSGPEVLDRAVEDYIGRFGDGDVPRPGNWSGFWVRPERIEFWQEQPHRLHRRMLYTRHGDSWKATWLFP